MVLLGMVNLSNFRKVNKRSILIPNQIFCRQDVVVCPLQKISVGRKGIESMLVM